MHIAAADGDLEGLKEVAKENRSLLFKADHNGWRPIHEAARSGQRKVLEYLIEEGTSPTYCRLNLCLAFRFRGSAGPFSLCAVNYFVPIF